MLANILNSHSRANVKWVGIDEVIPNPLNPRKDDSVKTQEMQNIINQRGWEIPLTVYQKGKYYVILAGHRRRYAAKQAGVKELPVFVVEAPKDHQEEVERIASLQRGQVDWTPYEWGKFTLERWTAWNKPSYTDFAKQMSMPERTVKEYLTVLQYYPRHEIEMNLQTGVYAMSTLYELVTWINKLKIYKSELVSDLGEEMIRKTMLHKIANRHVNRDHLRFTESLFKVVSDKDLLAFLTNTTYKLKDLLDLYSIEKPKKTLQGRLIKMGIFRKEVLEFDIPVNAKEQEAMMESLKELDSAIRKKMRQIDKIRKEKG